MLLDIQGWLNELNQVEAHLRGDQGEKSYSLASFKWTALENPALDLPDVSKKKEVLGNLFISNAKSFLVFMFSFTSEY